MHEHSGYLLSIMRSPGPKAVALIDKACAFAQNCGNSRRYNPSVFEHCYRTAAIVAELGLGRRTIASALLHDILGYTDTSEVKIEEEFGEEILFILRGIRNLSNINRGAKLSRTESLLKFFLAASHDLRVLIIKLAERLDTMRHINATPHGEQKKIARETMDIYMPLAGRLGMRTIQRELEDLAFQTLDPENYAATKLLMQQKEKSERQDLTDFRKSLLKIIAKEHGVRVASDVRLKTVHSIFNKLKTKGDPHKIYDIKAIRINLPTTEDCYRVLGIIHSHFRPLPRRIKDYIASPKPNGYQSIHTTVITGKGSIAEIQIRTFAMHEKAEFGVAAHENYKEDGRNVISKWFHRFFPAPSDRNGEEEDERYKRVPDWVKQLVDVKSYVDMVGKFNNNLQFDFIQEQEMFVFSHDGVVIDLPRGATVIDFAFALDTRHACHLTGARVNHKFVSIETKLKDGDIVEIQTKPKARPTRKWLPHAKTALARNEISQHLRAA